MQNPYIIIRGVQVAGCRPTWIPVGRVFAIEASDLYDIIGDKGIPFTLTVRNERTQGQREFTYYATDYSPEGEIQGWLFLDVAEDCRLQIYND